MYSKKPPEEAQDISWMDALISDECHDFNQDWSNGLFDCFEDCGFPEIISQEANTDSSSLLPEPDYPYIEETQSTILPSEPTNIPRHDSSSKEKELQERQERQKEWEQQKEAARIEEIRRKEVFRKQMLAELDKEKFVSKEEMLRHESNFLNQKESVREYTDWLIWILHHQNKDTVLEIHYEFIERYLETLSSKLEESPENKKQYYKFHNKLLSGHHSELIRRLKIYIISYLKYLNNHHKDTPLDKIIFCDYASSVYRSQIFGLIKHPDCIDAIKLVINILKEIAGRQSATKKDRKNYYQLIKYILLSKYLAIIKQNEHLTAIKQVLAKLKMAAERTDANIKDKQEYIIFVKSILRSHCSDLIEQQECVEAIKSVLAILKKSSKKKNASEENKNEFLSFLKLILNVSYCKHLAEQSVCKEAIQSEFIDLREKAGMIGATEKDKKNFSVFVSHLINYRLDFKTQPEYVEAIKYAFDFFKEKAEKIGATQKDKEAYYSFVKKILSYPSNTKIIHGIKYLAAIKELLSALKIAAEKNNATQKDKLNYISFVKTIFYSRWHDLVIQPECIEAAKSILAALKAAAEQPDASEESRNSYIVHVKNIIYSQNLVLIEQPECKEAITSIFEYLKERAEKDDPDEKDIRNYCIFIKHLITCRYKYLKNFVSYQEALRFAFDFFKAMAEKENATLKDKQIYYAFVKDVVSQYSIVTDYIRETKYLDAIKKILTTLKITAEKEEANETDKKDYINFVKAILSSRCLEIVALPECIEAVKSILAALKAAAEQPDVGEDSRNSYIVYVKNIIYSRLLLLFKQPECKEAITSIFEYLKERAEKDDPDEKDIRNYCIFIKYLITCRYRDFKNTTSYQVLSFAFDFFKEKAEKEGARKNDKLCYYKYVKGILSNHYSIIITQYLADIKQLLATLKLAAEKQNASKNAKQRYILFVRAIINSKFITLVSQPECISAIKNLIKYFQKKNIIKYQRYLMRVCSYERLCSSLKELIPFIEENLLFCKAQAEKEENIEGDKNILYQNLVLVIMQWPKKILNLSQKITQILEQEKVKFYDAINDLLPAPETINTTSVFQIKNQIVFKFLEMTIVPGIKHVKRCENPLEFTIVFDEPNGKEEYQTWWNEGKKLPASEKESCGTGQHEKRSHPDEPSQFKDKTTKRQRREISTSSLTEQELIEPNISRKRPHPDLQKQSQHNEKAKRPRELTDVILPARDTVSSPVMPPPKSPMQNYGFFSMPTMTKTTACSSPFTFNDITSTMAPPAPKPQIKNGVKRPKSLPYKWSCFNNIAIIKPFKGRPLNTKFNIRQRINNLEFMNIEKNLAKYVDLDLFKNKVIAFLTKQPPEDDTLESFLLRIGFDPSSRVSRDEQQHRDALSQLCKKECYSPMFYIRALLQPDQQKVVFVSDMLKPEEIRKVIENRRKLCTTQYGLTELNSLTLNNPVENNLVSAEITQPLPEGKTLIDCLNSLNISIDKISSPLLDPEDESHEKIAGLCSF